MDRAKKISRVELYRGQGCRAEYRDKIDTGKLKNMEDEYEILKIKAPIGNREHPATKRMIELGAILDNTNMHPKKREYRAVCPDGTFYVISKLEYMQLVGVGII